MIVHHVIYASAILLILCLVFNVLVHEIGLVNKLTNVVKHLDESNVEDFILLPSIDITNGKLIICIKNRGMTTIEPFTLGVLALINYRVHAITFNPTLNYYGFISENWTSIIKYSGGLIEPFKTYYLSTSLGIPSLKEADGGLVYREVILAKNDVVDGVKDYMFKTTLPPSSTITGNGRIYLTVTKLTNEQINCRVKLNGEEVLNKLIKEDKEEITVDVDNINYPSNTLRVEITDTSGNPKPVMCTIRVIYEVSVSNSIHLYLVPIIRKVYLYLVSPRGHIICYPENIQGDYDIYEEGVSSFRTSYGVFNLPSPSHLALIHIYTPSPNDERFANNFIINLESKSLLDYSAYNSILGYSRTFRVVKKENTFGNISLTKYYVKVDILGTGFGTCRIYRYWDLIERRVNMVIYIGWIIPAPILPRVLHTVKIPQIYVFFDEEEVDEWNPINIKYMYGVWSIPYELTDIPIDVALPTRFPSIGFMKRSTNTGTAHLSAGYLFMGYIIVFKGICPFARNPTLNIHVVWIREPIEIMLGGLHEVST